MSTEREKMAAGEWYSCMDGELDILRRRARGAVHQHNTMPPDERGAIAPLLRALFNSVGEGAFLEAPFHCARLRQLRPWLLERGMPTQDVARVESWVDGLEFEQALRLLESQNMAP